MLVQVTSYLGEDHVSVESDPERLAGVQRLLNRIPNLTTKNWVKPHKVEMGFVVMQTKRRAQLYVYRNVLLIVSKVAHLDDLDEERFGGDKDRLQRVREWCLDQNRQLTLGFLHVNGIRELNLCERLLEVVVEACDVRDGYAGGRLLAVPGSVWMLIHRSKSCL
jgi:hypothetical protein